MKISLTLFVLSAFSIQSFCQKNTPLQASTDFLQNKLYVVATEYPAFDLALKEVMTKEWNVSTVGGYISRKELKEIRKSKGNSFVDPTTAHWDANNMNSSRSASGIHFYQGGSSRTSDLKFVTHVAYFGGWTGDNYDSSIYRLQLMIRSMNSDYKYEKSQDSIQKIYKPSLLKKKKVLLLHDRYFSDRKREQVFEKNAMSNYRYNVKIVSASEIEELIKAKDPGYVFAVPIVNDATRMVYLYDVETGILIGKFARSGAFALPIRSKDVDSLIELINTP